jgi:molybdate transport system regulatory protein
MDRLMVLAVRIAQDGLASESGERFPKQDHQTNMNAGKNNSGVRLRIVLEPSIAIGPGKADILEGIRETGSIAAAGRRMHMSYKRAWLLVESMNACFKNPLVVTRRGGRIRGGAMLTPDGEKVLACYRRMEALTARATNDEMTTLRSMMAKISERE